MAKSKALDVSRKFLDLDAVTEGIDVVVKLNGVDHVMKPLDVESWVKNTQIMTDLAGKELSTAEQVDLMVNMLIDAFPTLTADELKKLSLVKLNALTEFAQTATQEGVDELAKQKAAAEQSPTSAGQ